MTYVFLCSYMSQTFLLVLFLRFIDLLGRKCYSEKEEEREGTFIHTFTPQMATMVRTVSGQN